MKALLCLECTDIIAPYRTDGKWRVCQCGSSAIRWMDGKKGTAQVTAFRNVGPLVLGLDNAFLGAGVKARRNSEQWRGLHASTTEDVGKHYLFHAERRNCWAILVHQGETGDVAWVPWSVFSP